MTQMQKTTTWRQTRFISCFLLVALLIRMGSPLNIKGAQPEKDVNDASSRDQEKRKGSTASKSSHFATFAGIAVHYESYGAGREALAFIPPWGGDVSFWRFQVPAFEGKMRVILIDLPGHGQSDKPFIAHTQDLFAGAVHAVLRDAGVNHSVLVGNSMGGLLASQFYRLYPKMTKALVIVDIPLRPFDSKEFLEKQVAPMRGPNYKEVVTRLFDQLFVPESPPSLRQEIMEKILRTPQNVLVSAQEQMADPKIWQPDPINVPVLGIYSKRPYIAPDNERFMRTFIPRLDYQAWDGVGHFIMMEKPQQFNEALIKFLIQHNLLKKAATDRDR